MTTYRVERSSALDAPALTVWASATSIRGVNAELAPWLRMSAPPGVTSLDGQAFSLGQPLFTSYVFLFGVLPVERMRVTLEVLEPGRRFVERSRMLALASWRHDRSVEALGPVRCRVTDRLELTPRAGGSLPRRMVEALFAHRHRMLARMFGAVG